MRLFLLFCGAISMLWMVPAAGASELPATWESCDVTLDGAELRTWLPKGIELSEFVQAKAGVRARLDGAVELLRNDFVADRVVGNLALLNGGVGRIDVEVRWDHRWIPLQDWQGAQVVPEKTKQARDTAAEDFRIAGEQGVYPYEGPLSGLTIALSPGHGWTWENGAWHTQRSLINYVVEDHSNARLVNWHVIPQLIRAGARVFSVREADSMTEEVLIDNDIPAEGYASETGWFEGSGLGWDGGTYDVCPTTQNVLEQAWATYTPHFTKSGIRAVYIFFRAGENRVTDALVEIRHAGITTRLEVNQERNDNRWLYLGHFYFDAEDDEQYLRISNYSEQEGYVIADAVRFGGGMGTQTGYDPPGTSVSGYPRWQEASRYYCSYNQGPDWACRTDTDDRTGDITTRPLYSRWRSADLYISWHSNAFDGSATGTRTISYLYDSSNALADLNQDLRDGANDAMVEAIRAVFDSSWFGSTMEMNLGEIRELADEIPGFLIETAFHDNPDDAQHIVNPAFRSLVARAVIKSLIDHYAPDSGLYPLPVRRVRLRQVGDLRVRLEWDDTSDPVWPAISQPDAYRIYTARNRGLAFDHGAVLVDENAYETELNPGETTCFNVAALNSGGESLPSEVLCARLFEDFSANGLLINGFDRYDRSVQASDNTRNYLARHAEAIAASGCFSFVSSSNEAVRDGLIDLADYEFVDWALGEESTANHTFDDLERSKLGAFLDGGGKLFLSGAEQGWDLVEKGNDDTTAWYESRLSTQYESDDAGTHYFQGASSGPYHDVGIASFDGEDGETYDVDWPDVVSAKDGAQTCLVYSTSSGGAGVCRAEAPAVVHWGFPFETVTGRLHRAALMQRTLHFLEVSEASVVQPESELEGDSDEEAEEIEVEWIETEWAEEIPEPDGDDDLDEDKYIPSADADADPDNEAGDLIPWPESENPGETDSSDVVEEKPDERTCPEGFYLEGSNCVREETPGTKGGCRSLSTTGACWLLVFLLFSFVIVRRVINKA